MARRARQTGLPFHFSKLRHRIAGAATHAAAFATRPRPILAVRSLKLKRSVSTLATEERLNSTCQAWRSRESRTGSVAGTPQGQANIGRMAGLGTGPYYLSLANESGFEHRTGARTLPARYCAPMIFSGSVARIPIAVDKPWCGSMKLVSAALRIRRQYSRHQSL